MRPPFLVATLAALFAAVSLAGAQNVYKTLTLNGDGTVAAPADFFSVNSGSMSSSLGLGTAATADTGDFATAAQGATADATAARLAGTGTATVNGNVTVSGTGTLALLDFVSSAPATATSTGTAGQLIISGNYIYICIAANTWQRAQLFTW